MQPQPQFETLYMHATLKSLINKYRDVRLF